MQYSAPESGPPAFRAVTTADLEEHTTRAGLAPEQRLRIRAVAAVLGFHTTGYVTDELIDWSDAPDDPIYRLVFPDENMLPAADVTRITDLFRQDAPAERIADTARQVRAGLHADHSPHRGERILPGAYRTDHDRVLVIPSRRPDPEPDDAFWPDLTRWPAGPGRVMAASDVRQLIDHLVAHPEVSGVRLAGADPLALGAPALRRLVEPLLALEQLESVQIDSSALACWPYRLLTDPDADDTLRLFEQVTASGRALTLMAAFSHPRQLCPAPVAGAVDRIRGTGAMVRTRGSLIGSVNDDADAWASLWRTQIRMGMVPYAMTVERLTGTGHRFAVPLARAHDTPASPVSAAPSAGR
ncbi:lysine 2,3-aminomutase [Actinoallomurus acaciae]|uniref:Lysine 2,3-aminomutase n=1 Tax=Actinoallomurus acaciae TaxID=502577 RepID=A0ABV5YPT3_9ACTN